MIERLKRCGLFIILLPTVIPYVLILLFAMFLGFLKNRNGADKTKGEIKWNK